MEQDKHPKSFAVQSAQHFEHVVDEWMKLEPWNTMSRDEARHIIAGLTILIAQRAPEGVDSGEMKISREDFEEAKRLCDEAEAQGLYPFGFPMPPEVDKGRG